MNKAAQAYFQTKVNTTDQGQLLLMLYDGALSYLQQARDKMLARDFAAKGILISKVIDIVNELSASLNMDKGGSLAENPEQSVYPLHCASFAGQSENERGAVGQRGAYSFRSARRIRPDHRDAGGPARGCRDRHPDAARGLSDQNGPADHEPEGRGRAARSRPGRLRTQRSARRRAESDLARGCGSGGQGACAELRADCRPPAGRVCQTFGKFVAHVQKKCGKSSGDGGGGRVRREASLIAPEPLR